MFWIPNGAYPARNVRIGEAAVGGYRDIKASGVAGGGGGVHFNGSGAEIGGEEEDAIDVGADGETLVDGAQRGVRCYSIVDGEDRIVRRGEASGPGGYRPVLGTEDERSGSVRSRNQECRADGRVGVPHEAVGRRELRAT